MKLPAWLLSSVMVLGGVEVQACGPTPQKVVASIEVSLPAQGVLDVLSQPAAIMHWHPLVAQAEVSQTHVTQIQDSQIQAPLNAPSSHAPEEASAVTQSRQLTLRNGWVLQEVLRTPMQPMVAEDSLMTGGTVPISQYRGVLTVLPLDGGRRSRLVWSARFNNQANLLDAPAGRDNAAAIAAVTDFYQQGLHGLKQFLEARSTQLMTQIKEIQ